MISLNDGDCLTCSFAAATGVGYKSIFYTIRLLSNDLSCLPENLINLKSTNLFRALLFSKRSMVVCYQHIGTSNGHAVAFVNGYCIDNYAGSPNTGKTLWQLRKSRKIIAIWSK